MLKNQNPFPLILILLFLSYNRVSASCPENLCDCSWSTPGFDLLGTRVGSIKIGVCTVLPNAVVNLYHGEIEKYVDYVTNENVLIDAANAAKDEIEEKFIGVIGEVAKLENTLGIKAMQEFFTSGDLLDVVEDVVDGLEATKEGVIQGIVIPVRLATMFPKLLNGVNPDLVTDFIKERGEKIITWFTESLVDVSQGVGSQSCATCLVDNLNNGAISFSIGVNTKPELSLSLIIRSTQALECLVNSFAELSKILHDSIPDEIEQGWDAISDTLVVSAQSLADASEAVVNSDFCNTEFDIPSADFNTNTGLDVLDDFTAKIEDIVNIVGLDGPFAKILQTVTESVCDAASFDEFRDFAVSLEEFLEIVSFSSIENRILKGLFGVVHKLSINIGAFRLENFDVDVDNCNTDNRACRLASKYGLDYVKCIQASIQSQTLGFLLTLSFGEHWMPPSFVGVGGSLVCLDIDCVRCISGMNNDGSILGSLKFLGKELLQLSSSDNSENPDCEVTLDCGTGTFDENICACRCSTGFIAGKNGCLQCPTVSGNICNNKGACYIDENQAKCCCHNGISTKDCSE